MSSSLLTRLCVIWDRTNSLISSHALPWLTEPQPHKLLTVSHRSQTCLSLRAFSLAAPSGWISLTLDLCMAQPLVLLSRVCQSSPPQRGLPRKPIQKDPSPPISYLRYLIFLPNTSHYLMLYMYLLSSVLHISPCSQGLDKFYSLLYPQALKQSLANSRQSVNVCGTTEWIYQWRNSKSVNIHSLHL